MGEAPWALDGYDVERLLGFGATGEVWRAREQTSGRLVAVKRLRLARTGGTGSAARDRLRREGALLAAFSHPHVVGLRTVIDAPEGGALVLELAGGGSLAGVLAARGRLEAGEVVTTAAPLAEALAAAHARGLLHGDVSPSNVLYASDGRPLLADLGVARLVGEPLGAVDGTAEYLDPAVAAGRPPTAASDVHALAAVCYHALAGTPPYAAATHAATLAAVASWRFHPLAPLAPDAPAALVAAVEAGLAADPGQRPDAARFAASLYAACPAVAVRLTPVETVDPPSARSVRAETPLTTAETPLTRVETPLTAATAMTQAVWPPPAPGGDGRPTDSGGLARRVRGLLGRRPVRLAAAIPAALAAAVTAGLFWAHSSESPGGQRLPVVSAPPALAADPAGWRALLAGLDEKRQTAFARGEEARLEEVYVEGSAPHSADVLALHRLLDRGRRAIGVRHDLQDVRVLAAGPDEVTLEVVDVMPAYDVLGAGGGVEEHVNGRGPATWRTVLFPAAGTWRIGALTSLT